MDATEPMETCDAVSGNDVGQEVITPQPDANGNSDHQEPSTSNGANENQLREVTFDEFIETCLSELVDEANPAEQIRGQLVRLKEKYAASQVWKNKALTQILSHFDCSIRNEPEISAKHLLLYDFQEEFKRLDRFLATLKSKDKKERAKLMKKIKTLQTQIKKDLRKIDRLDQEEISIDELDDENNAFNKKQKYEARVQRFAKKLLSLQGMNKISLRRIDKVYKYTGTQYPAINDAISSKYRAIMQKKYKGRVPTRPLNSTPNIHDIVDIINNVIADNNLTIMEEVNTLAFKITEDIVNEVKLRRDMELTEMMNDYEHDSHLAPKEVASLDDEELNQKLNSNIEVNRDSLIKAIDNFKKKLDETGQAETELGGDGTASEDEEDEEEEDPMNGLDEDEEVSEDDEEAGNEGENAAGEEEDDGDDPIILDEGGPPQNGNAHVNGEGHGEGSGEGNGESNGAGQKRAMDSEATDGIVNCEQSKKVKSDEQPAPCETTSDSNVKKESQVVTTEADTKKEVDETSNSEPTKSNSDDLKEEKEENIVNNSSTLVTGSSSTEKTEKVEPNDDQVKHVSESEDSIKIVDLEAENRSLDDPSSFNDVDDDDVICLD